MHVASISLFGFSDICTMLDRRVLWLNSRYNVKLYSVLAIILATAFIIMTSIYNGLHSHMSVVTITKQKQVGPPYYPSPRFSLNTSDVYGIMFDAGSTGTRIHVLHFTREGTDSNLYLLGEVFEQVKPGLSSFAESPESSLEGLTDLLNIAKESIPEYKWAETPVALKATAGLRLLPQDQAQSLLDLAYKLFEDSPFKVQEGDVSIMDGSSEGLYMWFTVNFLRGSFIDPDLPPVACFDLGGGSCQMAFLPKSGTTLSTAPQGYIQETEAFGKSYNLYVHSYLGLGLHAARLAILGGEDSNSDSENILFHTLSSPCLPMHHEEEWSFNGLEYTVKGVEPIENRFHECYQKAQLVVGSQVHQAAELLTQTVYAFSYVIDKIEESGFIEIEEPQSIKVGDINLIAQRECDSPREDNAFLCMDLVFISALLRNGFGFHDDSQLVLQKRIDDVEVSWALGAAVHLLNRQEV
ncbi:ectonucleoside triphosphate diphosphohydrolase 5-like isoform X2 [Ptychodera flava]|uniref:ectonucleoside triphosphate diphosphohydrolase 5-like isoform X2 n=1 Tax=Ptychodera flava TaxID=63121 RepID=UPI003969C39F